MKPKRSVKSDTTEDEGKVTPEEARRLAEEAARVAAQQIDLDNYVRPFNPQTAERLCADLEDFRLVTTEGDESAG